MQVLSDNYNLNPAIHYKHKPPTPGTLKEHPPSFRTHLSAVHSVVVVSDTGNSATTVPAAN